MFCAPEKGTLPAVGNNGLDRPEIQSVRDRQARIARIDPQASGKRQLHFTNLDSRSSHIPNHYPWSYWRCSEESQTRTLDWIFMMHIPGLQDDIFRVTCRKLSPGRHLVQNVSIKNNTPWKSSHKIHQSITRLRSCEATFQHHTQISHFLLGFPDPSPKRSWQGWDSDPVWFEYGLCTFCWWLQRPRPVTCRSQCLPRNSSQPHLASNKRWWMKGTL